MLTVCKVAKMKIEKVSVDNIKPYHSNPRVNQDAVEIVKKSIKEFGFQQPIVLDKNNEIIVGHTRYEALKDLNIEKIDCVYANDLNEQQIKAYRIMDNKSAEFASWNYGLLTKEMTELLTSEYDLSLTGFDDVEIKDLGLDIDLGFVEEGLTDDDAVPDLPEEPTTKLGDLWILGEHRLLCGDSTSIDDVDKLMDGNKADMVFTDPPYGVEYEGIMNDSRNSLEELLRCSFGSYFATSKSGASIYCFHSDKCADIFNNVFREFFHFSSMIIWAKNTLTLSQTDYQSQHEPCLYGWMKNGTHKWYSDRKQTSLWKFDKESVAGHTTPKPVALINKAINNSSKSGDLVIDFFGGSGSTIIACEKTNRHCRMMELDPKYCDVIIQRWEDFTGKDALNSDINKTFSELQKNTEDGE